jgi:hypothetical protein
MRNLKAVKSELEGQLDKATADEKKAADVAQGMYKVLKCASTYLVYIVAKTQMTEWHPIAL